MEKSKNPQVRTQQNIRKRVPFPLPNEKLTSNLTSFKYNLPHKDDNLFG